MWYVVTEIFSSPVIRTFALFIAFVVGVRVVIAIAKKVKDSALVTARIGGSHRRFLRSHFVEED